MFTSFRHLFRLMHIYWILCRYNLDEYVFWLPPFKPFHFLHYLNFLGLANRKKSLGVRIRLALQELGPIFVKFGQTLSTRHDLFPPLLIEELSKLQDKVPAFNSQRAKKMIEAALGQSISEIFSEFEMTPLAAASIAQVHTAKLMNGDEVIVKVLRPNVLVDIDRDVGLMYFLARFLQRFVPRSRPLRPVEVVAEFDQIIHDELDLQREAANASQLKRNFAGSDLLYVPQIYWNYTRSNVLVMERIHGIHISNIESLKAHGINLQALAERGVEIFFTQVFRDCFFHADMHPGNIFVDKDRKENPLYLGVDFGIMGSLSKQDQRYLAENLLAFFHQDYRRVAELHIASGWVAADTRVDLLEAAIRSVCEPIFQKPLKDISFAQVLLRLFQIARRFDMTVQPQLVLLQKTLFNVEGLGRQLYPELDLWKTAQPFLESWIKTKIGPKAFFKKVKENLPFWLERLPEMPELIFKTIEMNTNQTAMKNEITALNANVLTLQKQRRYANYCALFFGIALLAITAYGLFVIK